MDISEEWGLLCDTYAVADIKERKARAVAIEKISAIAIEKAFVKPTDEELELVKSSYKERYAVISAMSDFAKKHFDVDL